MKAAARAVGTESLDHFPPLVIYTCLEEASEQLADAAAAALAMGAVPDSEVITMPRKGLGPRPVQILSPSARCAYTAIVAEFEPSLPASSRREGAWTEFREFGRTGNHSHVVELDFASCYEFIDHSELRNELFLRHFNIDALETLRQQFSGIGERGRGLPQMLGPSDRLADCYLSIIDRSLGRRGLESLRYADDLRVLADSWETANEVVEFVADQARSLGLILSSGKTTIRRREGIDAIEAEPMEYFESILSEVHDDLTEWVEVSISEYSTSLEPIPPEQEEALVAAYSTVLSDWHELFRTSQSEHHSLVLPKGMAAHIGPAVKVMIKQNGRLEEDLLADLVFQDAGRLEGVCRYIGGRRAQNSNEDWGRLIEKLIGMGRQSPWAKLWLLHVIDDSVPREDLTEEMSNWVVKQTADTHEVVRASAAWTLAGAGKLVATAIDHCYRRSSPVSQPALAAAVGRQNASTALGGAPVDTKVSMAIRDDSKLNKCAYEWAES